MTALAVPPITAPTGPRNMHPIAPPTKPDVTVLFLRSSFSSRRYSSPVIVLDGKGVAVVVVVLWPCLGGLVPCEFFVDGVVAFVGELRACENGGIDVSFGGCSWASVALTIGVVVEP